jgi:hypothetical protein
MATKGTARNSAIRGLVWVALALGLAANAVRADELHLLLNGKAIHVNPPAGSNYNEKNWGFGVQYEFAPDDPEIVTFVNASGFRDSNSNPSYYAGGGVMRRFQPDLFGGNVHVDLGAIAFVMTRKDFHDGHPFPGILPAASVGTDAVALNISFVPKVDPKMTALWFLQLKVRLGKY